MKKVLNLFLCIVLLGGVVKPVFAGGGLELNNENKYGMPLEFDTNPDYPGEIIIDGIYVYKDDVDYIFTILYSNGELVTENNNGEETVLSSFFDSDDIFQVSSNSEFDRISSHNNIIQYRIDVEKALQVNFVTVFLYDVTYGDDAEKNISCYINMNDNNLELCPTIDELINGYEVSSNQESVELEESPSSWAHKSIEELMLSNLFRKSAFEAYTEGISRERFIYLMVELYELLTGQSINIDESVTFDDTTDEYALKAAKIGITNGIGNNKFGPDIILNREQMTTFLIRTLGLANIDLSYSEDIKDYDDEEEISSWAKDSVYIAKYFGIMGGTGNNKFSPLNSATNEQALAVIRRLLGEYGVIKWYKEFDGNRIYVRINKELYSLKFENNVVLDLNSTDKGEIYFESFNDIELFINAAHIKKYNISYDPIANPNIKGTLNVDDYGYMGIEVENQYFGVDKIGEKMTISINSDYNTSEFISTITTDMDNAIKSYTGLKEIKYYDENDNRNSMITLPTHKIFSLIGINYTIEYHKLWNIYILEFN